MSQTTVNVTIRGRNFPITCARGEQDSIKALAAEIDQRLEAMAKAAPHASDSQISVLTMLTMAAELKQSGGISDEEAQAQAAAQAQADSQMLEALGYFEGKLASIEKKLAG